MKPTGAQRLAVRLVSFATACGFVERFHRTHSRPSVSHRYSLGVIAEDGFVHGAAMCGRPVARGFDRRTTIEITRVATDGIPNGCSALYGAARREGLARGFLRFVTYTLASEPGTSLRAAGFRETGRVRARPWSCASRPRRPHAVAEKIRWEWP